jgi:surface polysaccharide O-acyltransferase-like enzyme
MRRYYIDNLRWISVLMLFPYHACMVYNNFGENFYIKSDGIPLLSGFIEVNYSWFMPLLFVISGISSRYALNIRTQKEFIKERVLKLFIPLVSGILLLVPMQTFYAEKFHNGYDEGYFHQYIIFFTKETDLTGYTGGFTPAHLWFILYLFIISLVALPVIEIYKKSKHKIPVDKLSVLSILPMFIIFLVMALILDIGGKSLGEYFALFMLGYIILSEDTIQLKLEKNRWCLFGTFIIMTVLNMIVRNLWHSNLGIIYDMFSRLLTWFGILGIMGMSKHYLNFNNKVTRYFSKASFPIYIFHQSLLVLTAYYTLKIISSAVVQVVLIVIISFVLTMIMYEMLKRIPITRFLFGIKE